MCSRFAGIGKKRVRKHYFVMFTSAIMTSILSRHKYVLLVAETAVVTGVVSLANLRQYSLGALLSSSSLASHACCLLIPSNFGYMGKMLYDMLNDRRFCVAIESIGKINGVLIRYILLSKSSAYIYTRDIL